MGRISCRGNFPKADRLSAVCRFNVVFTILPTGLPGLSRCVQCLCSERFVT